jgi:hypothetical protein
VPLAVRPARSSGRWCLALTARSSWSTKRTSMTSPASCEPGPPGVAWVQWSGYIARIAPCWANHPEAVRELSNFMTEWTRMYSERTVLASDALARSGRLCRRRGWSIEIQRIFCTAVRAKAV